jgi:hypothetical protein
MDQVKVSATVGAEFTVTTEVAPGDYAWHFVVIFAVTNDTYFQVGAQTFTNQDVRVFSDPMCIACRQEYTPEIGVLPCPMT